MLFRGLDAYLFDSTTPRSLPHLSNYIDTLNVKRGIITDRYTDAVGYESPIVVLLRKILADADIPALLQRDSDFACYFDVLIYTDPDLNSIFDAVTTGLTFTNTVIRNNPAHTEEFLIPVQCQDPPTDLPFDLGWDAWREVKPIRLVDIDSLELTFQTYQDQIVYTKTYPSRAVFTIDVVALVLQYINFLRTVTPMLDQPEYLHRYVLIHLLQDLEDIWLGNIYDAVMKTPIVLHDRLHLDLNALFGDQYYGFVGSEFPIALREVLTLVDACRAGVVNPSVLLKSLRLSSSLIPHYLRQLLQTTQISQRRQNAWTDYLKEIRWLSLIYDAYQLQPSFVGTKNLHTALKRDIPILYATRIWSNCHNTKIQHFIESDMKRLLNLVK